MKLFIDSSTDYLYLALVNNNLVYKQITKSKRDHSETLVDHLSTFLQEYHINIFDIDTILVGRGPGSYTGLRIAGTVAKVWAYDRKITFLSFSTLDLLLTTAINDGNYLARIVAKKNHSYYKAININNTKLNIICNDIFNEDSYLDPFKDYQQIEVNEETMDKIDVLQLLVREQTKEEDIFNYVPNYLRSEL